MIRIEDFEFSKPPDIFRRMIKARHAEFYIAGSVSTPEEYIHLKETLRSKPVLEFFDSSELTRVLVADQRFQTHAVWGFRYELLLMEYKPIHMRRRKIIDNIIEDIGERILSPRFRIIVELDGEQDEISSRKIIDYDFDIRIGLLEDTERFKVKFEDRNPLESARKNFNKWTQSPELSVEVFLGYLEQGDLVSVAKGKANQIKHGIRASSNWIELEGSGKARTRPQEHVYSLQGGENILDGSLSRTEQGSLLVNITTVLIPELKPKEMIDVFWDELGILQSAAKIDSLKHRMSLHGAFTKIAFTMKKTS